MILEQELKLSVLSSQKVDLTVINWPDTFQCDEVETSHLISVYHDTVDLQLSKQRLGLRMRKHDNQWLQTVKTSGTVSNGLHQRQEWEYELSSPSWDLSQLKQTPLAEIIEDQALWAQINEVFTTDFIRQTIQISLADGSKVELAYDRGHVRAGSQQTEIHEIELELKAGNVDCLTLLGDILSSQLTLQVSDSSKAKLGYQLLAKTTV